MCDVAYFLATPASYKRRPRITSFVSPAFCTCAQQKSPTEPNRKADRPSTPEEDSASHLPGALVENDCSVEPYLGVPPDGTVRELYSGFTMGMRVAATEPLPRAFSSSHVASLMSPSARSTSFSFQPQSPSARHGLGVASPGPAANPARDRIHLSVASPVASLRLPERVQEATPDPGPFRQEPLPKKKKAGLSKGVNDIGHGWNSEVRVDPSVASKLPPLPKRQGGGWGLALKAAAAGRGLGSTQPLQSDAKTGGHDTTAPPKVRGTNHMRPLGLQLLEYPSLCSSSSPLNFCP